MSELASVFLAALPSPGGYVSLPKVLIMVALAVPWLWMACWVDKDTRTVHAPRALWLPVVVGGGIVGLLAWVLVPLYIAGLAVYVVLATTVCMVYVVQRDSRVLPEARVLTVEHFSKLFQGKGGQHKGEIITRLKVYDKQGKPVPPPAEATSEEILVYNDVQELLYNVVRLRASEVDVAPSGQVSQVRFIIDGVVARQPDIPRTEGEEIIDYIKSVSGMDPAEKRRPQTGRISVDLANQPREINLTVAGSTSGQRLQMKDVQEAVRTHIEQLGLSKETLAKLRELAGSKAGLLIVSSRPRNGMTSTIYSLLRDYDAYIKQLVSVEEKPEVDMENVTQNRYKGGAQMARTLATAVRRDPDVIMVDKCEDAAGAAGILEAAGAKKILLGMVAPDSFTALAHWVKMAGDPEKAVRPLQAVLCQVLMRKLCPACREAYRPDPELLRKANLPTDKVAKFYRPPTQGPTDEKGRPLLDEKGEPVTCPTCQGIGYYGRIAAFELLEMNDDLRKLIGKGADLVQIKAAARKHKMLYLQEQALRKVMEGVTSIQEVIRVTRTKSEQG